MEDYLSKVPPLPAKSFYLEFKKQTVSAKIKEAPLNTVIKKINSKGGIWFKKWIKGSEFLFDVASPTGVRAANRIVLQGSGMDASAILKRVRSSRKPLVITQRGRATAVVLSVDAYEQSEEERQILLALARGERELQTGKGPLLDAVLREADKLLKNS